jgi:hypothetical protein
VASKFVLFTLEKTFGRCRGFHDLMGVLSTEKYEEEFINIASIPSCDPVHVSVSNKLKGILL